MKLFQVPRLTTPLALVIALTLEMMGEFDVDGIWYAVVLVAVVCTAVGIEAVGIVAGETLEGFVRARRWGWAALAFVFMGVYVGVTMYMLRNNDTLFLVLRS